MTASYEQTVSQYTDAAAAAASATRQQALHDDAYNFAPADLKKTPVVTSDKPVDEISQQVKPQHQWYDGLVDIVEGVADEAVHNPLHLLESAAVGAVGAAAVVGIAAISAPAAAVVGGVALAAGAVVGISELSKNLPKWSHEMDVVSSNGSYSDEEVAAASADLHHAGAAGADMAAGIAGGAIAGGVGMSMLRSSASAAAADAGAAAELSAPESQLALPAPERQLLLPSPERMTPLPASDAAPALSGPAADSLPSLTIADDAVAPPVESGQAAAAEQALTAETTQAAMKPIPVDEYMMSKPAVPYQENDPNFRFNGEFKVQRIDRPVALTSDSGTVVGGKGDVLVTYQDGRQAIYNENWLNQTSRPVPVELDTPMSQWVKSKPVTAELMNEPFTWTLKDGTVMHGNAGDWQVIQPNGSVSSVTDRVMQATYTHRPDLGANSWVKTAVTTAQEVDRPITIHTLEGIDHAGPGDFLVTGPLGEQYKVPQSTFLGMYESYKGT